VSETSTFRYSPNGEVSTGVSGRTAVHGLTTDAVLSPAGGREAFVTQPCGSYMDSHLHIDDHRAHRSWTIGAAAPACHQLGTPQFNPTGTELVFPWGASRLHTPAPSRTWCPQPRPSGLAVVAADHGSPGRSLKTIAPDPGCSFAAAAFDSTGIAAVEGCRHGSPKGSSEFSLGDGYLVQLGGPRHRVVKRIQIHRGVEQAVVAEDPATGDVLVTQDQPANNGTPPRDYVWSFDGSMLRLIGRYPAQDAARILAAPW
jgi:hypothetical protein